MATGLVWETILSGWLRDVALSRFVRRLQVDMVHKVEDDLRDLMQDRARRLEDVEEWYQHACADLSTEWITTVRALA